MKGFKELSAVALSLLAYTVSAEEAAAEAAAEAPSDVHVLKTDTFESFVKEHPLVLAECLFPRRHILFSLPFFIILRFPAD